MQETPKTTTTTVPASNTPNVWTINLKTSAVLINETYLKNRRASTRGQDLTRRLYQDCIQSIQSTEELSSDTAQKLRVLNAKTHFDVALLGRITSLFVGDSQKVVFDSSHVLESGIEEAISLNPLNINLSQWFVLSVSMGPSDQWETGEEILITSLSNCIDAQTSSKSQKIAIGSTTTLKTGDNPKPLCNSFLGQESFEDHVKLVLMATLGHDSFFDASKSQTGVIFCKANEILDAQELDEQDRELEVAVLFEHHIFALIFAKSPQEYVKRVYSFAWQRLKNSTDTFEQVIGSVPWLNIVMSRENYARLCFAAKKIRDEIYLPHFIRADQIKVSLHEAYRPPPKGKVSGELTVHLRASIFKPRVNQPHLLNISGIRPYTTELGLFQQEIFVCLRDQALNITRSNPVAGYNLVAYHFGALRKALEIYGKCQKRNEEQKNPAKKVSFPVMATDETGCILDVERLILDYVINVPTS